ncbi:YpdA family putative bacillithiol disulfide reductase [Weeksellaceae bacterium KMM 9713]|uniref:YpdA family putative bacillithiol disulfide reductase n=1 Tax=Profundicola chukchiensis TaxID=2961959 RepID=A0A9X4MZG8_9FLAO|nr:YpdA family putative bacillithiol disulfide reductase [Profundicola chukchiensis]MDG4946477.1 YpdA family putative bacillithiol disulfide reductase [Profundicola chukchiensis]
MPEEIYDVLIVGAGPMGIAVAIEAKKAGLSHKIIEKGALVNSIYHFPKNMTFFSTSQKLEIGDVPFMSNFEKPKRDEALEYYRRVVEKWDLNVTYYERVKNVTKPDDVFAIQTKRNLYQARNVVIATGFYGQPNKLNVPGEELKKVRHYFDEPHPYIGQKVAVVGAANSATQIALELYYKGADVSMIIRDNKIKDSVKYWIKPNIENRIEEGSIKAYFNSTVKEIKRNTIIIEQNGEEKHLDNDFVFAMIGYHPDYDFLNKIGVNCETDENNTPLYNPDTHETSIDGLYVAGVVCGGSHTSRFFIENSMEHAERITAAITKNNVG